MSRYRYKGETARSIPALSIELLQPGDTFESAEEINHPDFELVKESPARAASADKPAASKEG